MVGDAYGLIRVNFYVRGVQFTYRGVVFSVTVVHGNHLAHLSLFNHCWSCAVYAAEAVSDYNEAVFRCNGELSVQLYRVARVSSQRAVGRGRQAIANLREEDSARLGAAAHVQIDDNGAVGRSSNCFSVRRLRQVVRNADRGVFTACAHGYHDRVLLREEAVASRRCFLRILDIFLRYGVGNYLAFCQRFRYLGASVESLRCDVVQCVFGDGYAIRVNGIASHYSFSSRVNAGGEISGVVGRDAHRDPALLCGRRFAVRCQGDGYNVGEGDERWWTWN